MNKPLMLSLHGFGLILLFGYFTYIQLCPGSQWHSIMKKIWTLKLKRPQVPNLIIKHVILDKLPNLSEPASSPANPSQGCYKDYMEQWNTQNA